MPNRWGTDQWGLIRRRDYWGSSCGALRTFWDIGERSCWRTSYFC